MEVERERRGKEEGKEKERLTGLIASDTVKLNDNWIVKRCSIWTPSVPCPVKRDAVFYIRTTGHNMKTERLVVSIVKIDRL